jgi:hypothetical protein
MLNTLEAVLQTNGALHFFEPVNLAQAQRVLVTFTEAKDDALSGAHLSQAALALDWLNDDEEAAWAHLQPGAGQAGAKAAR